MIYIQQDAIQNFTNYQRNKLLNELGIFILFIIFKYNLLYNFII